MLSAFFCYNIFMSLTLLLILIVLSLNLIVATVILVNSRKSLSSWYFFILTLSITLWILANYLSNIIINPIGALVFNKLIFCFTTIFGWSFVLFSYSFSDNRKMPATIFLVYLFLAVVTTFISVSDYLVKDISFANTVSIINFGWGIYWYVIFLVFSIVWSFYSIICQYLRLQGAANNNLRSALKVIIGGLFLLLLFSLTTNLILPIFFSNFELTNYAPLYSLLFIGPVAYAVLKYNFLNIKLIASEILTLFLFAVTLVNVFNFSDPINLIFNLIILLVVVILGSLLIKSVITETKRLEELEIVNKKLKQATTKLEFANKELQRLDDAKSEFLSIASHQLRTPTTIIKGYISMMQEGSFGKVPAVIKINLDKVFIATERLLNLIENLLDISRIEAGRLEFKLEPIALGEIATEIKDDFKAKVKAKKIALNVYSPQDLPLVVTDRIKIKEVISNLVDNAIKYTKAGEITLDLHQEGRSVVLSISDTGIGISATDVGRLFNKFVRGIDSNTTHPEGTGLGLYFARVVVENLGGRIWVESAGKGRGSKFSFSLPLANKSQAKKIKN